MLELPRSPWYRRVWVFNLAIVVVVVALTAAAVLWSRKERAAAPATTRGVAADPARPDRAGPAPPETTPPAPATVGRGPAVVWEETGSGVHYGDPFEAPSRWRIVWSFDCRSFASLGGGNFKLSGEDDFDRVSVQQFAVRGSGTERMTGGGQGRLVIESVCDRWTVRAVAP